MSLARALCFRSALFQRFVDSNPDSPRLSEARYWLARSYEQGGDLASALAAHRAHVRTALRSIPLADRSEFHALYWLDSLFGPARDPRCMVEGSEEQEIELEAI